MIGESKDTYFILSVDDDEDVRELLHEVISHLGHSSVTAVDGVDGLEKLAQGHFDLVITDISMPRMGGLDFIKRIKGNFDDIDVIAITGFHAEYKYTDVIEVGASDFISKPFNINELEAKINRVIRERKMRTELKRLSVRDGLTGLYNRRYFDDNLRREASRSFRQQYGLFLLLIDIDHFKEYNDEFGHQQGDELLRKLAEIMMLHSRKNVDSVYRYGGDEFAVIIPHAKHRQAKIVANRLRSKFNQKDLGRTKLSMGMAKLKGGVETLEKDIDELLRSADQCLYHAKRKGGDQICEISHHEHVPDNPPRNSNPDSHQ